MPSPTPSSRTTPLATREQSFAPLAVGGPEPIGATPYAHWRVVSSTGSPAGSPVAGTTFDIDYAYRTGSSAQWGSWSTWIDFATIVDCVAATCPAGGDLDPDPGEFQVASSRADNTSTTQFRFRISPVSAPGGVTFDSTASRETQRASWSGSSHDFGRFTVAVAALSCASNRFYSVSWGGIVRELTVSSGAASIREFGSWSGDRIGVNGLGIGANGSVMYAFNRSGSNVTEILRYSTADGWGAIPNSAYTTDNNQVLVAGAVSPAGEYYFGGLHAQSGAWSFRLHKFDPATGRSTPVGSVATNLTAFASGDFAFDGAGNLTLVQGNASGTSVYTVTAATLAAARGGSLPRTERTSSTTVLNGMTGVAYDGDGTVFIADETEVRRYDPFTVGQLGPTLSTGLSSSSDLDSCVEPPTVSVVKNVVGRATPSDQFSLSLRTGTASTGGAVIGSATTSGTDTGARTVVAPIAVRSGSAFTMTETMASGSASSYTSTYACTRNGQPITTGVSGTGSGDSFTLTVPSTAGGRVVCTFTNTPPSPPVCTAGTIYSVSSGGVVREVTRGVQSNRRVGEWDSSNVNALGVASDGREMMALERSDNNRDVVRFLRYRSATGWEALPTPFFTTGNNLPIVAGAIAPDGRYYSGGYHEGSAGLEFRLHQYDANGPRQVGRVVMTKPRGTIDYGDMAFDKAGNLTILHSDANSVSTLSVTAATLAAARSGAGTGALAHTASPVIENTGVPATAGMAFDSDGTMYLSNETTVIGFDPVTFQNVGTLTTSPLVVSTDLASCHAPPTVAVVKQVESMHAAHEVTLELRSPGRSVRSVPVQVTGTGPQTTRIEAVPVRIGSTLTIAEAIAASAGGSYASAYSCTSDGQPPIASVSGTGTTFTLTVPSRPSAAIVCTFRNTALASLEVHHTWRIDGVAYAEGSQPDGLTASATATGPGSAGAATIAWGSGSSRPDYALGSTATVTVAPRVQGISCQTQSTTSTVTVDRARTVVSITTTVDCQSRLTLRNQVAYGTAAPESWTLSATGPAGSAPLSGSSGIRADVRPGANYALAHSGGSATHVPQGWACSTASGTSVAVTDDVVRVPHGRDVTCTLTQATAQLTLLKHIDPAGAGSLTASRFTLAAAPATFAGLTTVTVTGSETEVTAGARANRFDVRPGHTYSLSESSRYASLTLRLERWDGAAWQTVANPAAITAPVAGAHAVYRFVNAAPPALTLPVTGGIGSDAFTIGGTAALLLALIGCATVLIRSKLRTRQLERRLT